MKRTKSLLLIWLVVGLGYEAVTLFDNVPNNTVSHAVTSWSQEHAWLPLGIMFCVVLTAGHWFLKKWVWRPAVFVEEKKTED